MKTNRNTILLIFVILVVMIGAVFVLRPKPDNQHLTQVFNNPAHQTQAQVYFSKSKGSEIVTEPVVRPMPSPKPKTSRAALHYALSELLEGPSPEEQDQGYFSEIPPGTKLLSVKESPARIDIDLSQEFASGGGSNSMSQRLQEVVKTVASVPQKKPVYLKLEGKQLEVLGGEGVMVQEPITNDPSVTQ